MSTESKAPFTKPSSMPSLSDVVRITPPAPLASDWTSSPPTGDGQGAEEEDEDAGNKPPSAEESDRGTDCKDSDCKGSERPKYQGEELPPAMGVRVRDRDD